MRLIRHGLGFKSLSCYFVLLFSLSIQNAFAVDEDNPHLIDRQRAQYKSALQALKSGNTQTFQSLLSELKDYPLYPYLAYANLATSLSASRKNEVSEFLEAFDGQPVAGRLRHHWLEYLRKHDRWQTFMDFYQSAGASTEQDCYYQLARIRHGDYEKAVAQALDLWTAGKSQPKGCDPLFEVLIKDKLITEEVAWQRFTKAVLNHQYSLASYLKRFFSTPFYLDLSDKFYRVDRSPEILGNYPLFSEHPPEILQVIEHGLVHLASHDARKALGYWRLYHQTHPFTGEQEKTVVSALAKGLFQQGHKKAADTLLIESLPELDSSILEWRLRQSLAANDWQAINQWIPRLPESLQSESRWQYWSVRARHALKLITNQQAEKAYLQLAAKRNFYGFLAADRVNHPYAMEHNPIAISAGELQALDDKPAFKRVRELLYHGETDSAHREWNYITARLASAELLASARWATDEGWPAGAITSMILASYWDDIDVRFPMPFKKTFENNARQADIPLALLLALARQESAMRPDAVSPAGARGLIQLMPATASETARRNNIHFKGNASLHDPEVNVKIASLYYREMLNRFDNRVLATAAYNAGPYRVTRWLDSSGGKLPFDAWIETIPFYETRNYVQNVLAFSVIYNYRLGVDVPMLDKKELEESL